MIQSLLSSDWYIFHSGCFIIVKTERSGFTPRVVFYVFNPALTYPSCFRLRTNLSCKNSIRRGMYICPRQCWVLSLFHCYWSHLGHRLDPMMKRIFFSSLFLKRKCPCPLEPLPCSIPKGLNEPPASLGVLGGGLKYWAVLIFPPFCLLLLDDDCRRNENVTHKVFALIAGQLLLMICHFRWLRGWNIATIWNKM